jgi:predicted TIM-barrel fold metal-dependent hydrolase
MLIDCDVHVGYDSLLDLSPFLDGPTREVVTHSGTNGLAMPSYPWYHPSGWIRKDTYNAAETAQGQQIPGQTLESVRRLLLDPYDVTYGILTADEAAAFSIIPNASLGARLASAYNDWLIDQWLAEDARLRGLIVVAAQHPEAAAAEIQRLAGDDRFVGVFLPGGARVPYGNVVYDPIWKAASENGLPVVVHTHFDGVGISPPVTSAGHPDTYAEYHVLCGSGMYGHFTSVLLSGVFERFPGAKMVMVEGGLVPFLGYLWRLDADWKACRTEVPHCRRPPSEYVWESVRFTTQPLETPPDDADLWPVIRHLRPAETFMFASDYPHWDFDEPTHTLKLLPENIRDRVAFGNAAELFHLSAPAPVTA